MSKSVFPVSAKSGSLCSEGTSFSSQALYALTISIPSIFGMWISQKQHVKLLCFSCSRPSRPFFAVTTFMPSLCSTRVYCNKMLSRSSTRSTVGSLGFSLGLPGARGEAGSSLSLAALMDSPLSVPSLLAPAPAVSSSRPSSSRASLAKFATRSSVV